MAMGKGLERVDDPGLKGGAELSADGVGFALYSKHAEKVSLCLFDDSGTTETAQLQLHRHDDDIWRGFLPKAKAGLKYGYRVHGPYDPEQGHRFNANKLLVDPFARQLSGAVRNHDALFAYASRDGDQPHMDSTDSAPYVPKGIVTAPFAESEWQHPRTPLADSFVYELHVGGITQLHPGVPTKLRGTFEALTQPDLLQHIRDLGVTTVELLPVHPFADEPHLWRQGLSNYWGYNSYNFFATESRFGKPAQFRQMVQRFHQAGIEVWLDVVYNHTAEGDELGPTLSFRGIDNASYYRLQPHTPRQYVNDSGCGNVLDFDNTYVRHMVLDSLRYWVEQMGVDGFRFDLAPILARSLSGFRKDAPIFHEIADDPVLSGAKMIAEPWDVGPDGYRLGGFPLGWSEWNDRYRDTVRGFWRGDDHMMRSLADCLTGSKELFKQDGRRTHAGINYVAVHDGFTLEDTVSYSDKHNEANLEGNRDGHNHNLSHNHGVEGPGDDEQINSLRRQQKRNMLATLFLSQGVPMIQAGDEFGRTQQGNNNAYCQDNEINWLDWQNRDLALTAFVARLAELRRSYPQLRLQGFLSGESLLLGEVGDIVWLAPDGEPMQQHDWELHYARCFGFYLPAYRNTGDNGAAPLLVLLNAHHDAIPFQLPAARMGANWTCLLDTGLEQQPQQQNGFVAGQVLQLAGHSLMMFAADMVDFKAPPEPGEFYQLADLCERAGLERAYSDLSGNTHHLDDDSAAHLLEAFGFDVSTGQIIDQQVRDRLYEPHRRQLAPVSIWRRDQAGTLNRSASIDVHLDYKDLDKPLNVELLFEKGGTWQAHHRQEDLVLVDMHKVGHINCYQLTIPLPEALPLGYHDLQLRIGEQQHSCLLIVAPIHSYRPPWMQAEERVWGIAHQLYSLQGEVDKGIGDFGDLLDLAYAGGQCGADLIGLNPLHALFLQQPERVSPYAPSSRLRLNPLYIDVTSINGSESLIAEATADADSPDHVDYAKVAKSKDAALRQLFAHFQKQANHSDKDDFARFCQEHSPGLQTYGEFCVLQAHFAGKTFDEWPPEYRDHNSSQVKSFASKHALEVDYHCWLQWQADRQLQRAAAQCTEQHMKVGLYGDLAVGVAFDGADSWVDRESYARTLSFGAPPDAFNADGQNWGMPPMNPLSLEDSRYQPFINMLRENMHHFGALRIDHVMWLQRMFVIPLGEPASKGAYIRFPIDELLAVLALESHRSQCLIVGEDLGTVPLGFRERMHEENILSYRLMRFEKEYDGTFKAPDHYPYLALATPSSHDLPTLLGYFEGLDLHEQRELNLIKDDEALEQALRDRTYECQALIETLKTHGIIDRYSDWSHFTEPAIAERLVDGVQTYLASSAAALTMLNLEDIALSARQVNVPGTIDEVPNWRARINMPVGQLNEDERLLTLFTLVCDARKNG